MGKIRRVHLFSSFTCIILMAIALLITLLPHLLGWKIVVIQDDGMKGTYAKGSLVFVKEKKAADLHVGDVISYYLNQGEDILTRRIVAKELTSLDFYTKGDNQTEIEGAAVSRRNLIGEPLFHVPYLGFLMAPFFIKLAKILFWLNGGFLTISTILGLFKHRVALQD